MPFRSQIHCFGLQLIIFLYTYVSMLVCCLGKSALALDTVRSEFGILRCKRNMSKREEPRPWQTRNVKLVHESEKAELLSENIGRGHVYVEENEEVFRLSLVSESVGCTLRRRMTEAMESTPCLRSKSFRSLSHVWKGKELEPWPTMRGIRKETNTNVKV